MKKWIARSLLNRFSNRYGYDVGYMDAMLRAAPGAFFKFSKIMAVAGHRRAAPKEAYYAVKIVAAVVEDCGPCSQLAVDMAREAGVADDQIAAVLRRHVGAMSEATAAGFRFAEAVAMRAPDLDETRDAVRRLWGEEAVVELSLCFSIGRVFPMTKAAMGYARECRQVTVAGEPVPVYP